MKKTLFLFATCCLLFASCSSGPGNVAEKFAENVAKGNIEEAKKYCTKQTAAMLEMIKMVNKDKPDFNSDYKFEMIKDSIVGDKAWITYKSIQDENEEVIILVKEDGEWKVTMGK